MQRGPDCKRESLSIEAHQWLRHQGRLLHQRGRPGHQRAGGHGAQGRPHGQGCHPHTGTSCLHDGWQVCSSQKLFHRQDKIRGQPGAWGGQIVVVFLACCVLGSASCPRRTPHHSIGPRLQRCACNPRVWMNPPSGRRLRRQAGGAGVVAKPKKNIDQSLQEQQRSTIAMLP